MNKIMLFFAGLFIFCGTAQAQSLSPEEKARQAVNDMQKRLGLKDKQLQQVYHLNLDKIQKSRLVNEKANSPKKLDRHYIAICEEYNLRLRSVLTPDQFQRWEALREEARARRKVLSTQHWAENSKERKPGDPETELEQLVSP